MCMKTKCNSCGKFSFRGCGNHLFEIFKNDKDELICKCNPILIEFIKKRNESK